MIIVLSSSIFGKNVRYLRRKQNMSIFRLAGQLALPVWTLFRIEAGGLRDLEDVLVRRICSLFSREMQTMVYEKLYE